MSRDEIERTVDYLMEQWGLVVKARTKAETSYAVLELQRLAEAERNYEAYRRRVVARLAGPNFGGN